MTRQFLFWQTDAWRAYCAAYGGPVMNNDSPDNIIVPLGPEPEMLANTRPTHRACIRKAAYDLTVVVSPDDPLFGEYQRLHERELASKGIPERPQATFDIMRSWLGTHAVLFLAKDGEYVGAALFFIYGEGAYYASSARLPGARGPIGHFLVWSAMKSLALRGYEWLDLGHPHLDTDPSGGIASFKKGFMSRVKVPT